MEIGGNCEGIVKDEELSWIEEIIKGDWEEEGFWILY